MLEAVVLWRSGVAGIDLTEVDNTAAAVFKAIRPVLGGLLARIFVLYGVAGVGLALVSLLISPARWLLSWFVLLLLVAAGQAIHRPALFDDIPALHGALAVLTRWGELWHVYVAFALWWLVATRKRMPRAAVGLATLIAVNPVPVPTKPQGLVLVVGLDAFRPDRLTENGSTRVVAPNLEQFLQDATLFDRAYTPIAQTEPAWRSLLTARWPYRTGVRYPLTPEARVLALPTLPEALSHAGVATAFFTDCSRFNFQGPSSGFQERIQPPRGALNFALEKMRFRGVGLFGANRVGAWWLPEMVDNRALAGIYDPLGYADRLSNRIVEMASQGPAFVAFHATAAHFPGDPVYPYYRRFVSEQEPLERRLRMFFSPIGADNKASWNRSGAEALYDELLAEADGQLGRLLDTLRARGLYDDATIVVFSDHGESFHADHPNLAGATPVHGARLSEEENRILFAVKLPGQHQARRVDSLVRLIDLAPTLLELKGLPPLPGAEGESFVPALNGAPLSPRYLYAETGFTHASPDAFDPEHWAGAPRSFNAYSVKPDGVVETAASSHDAILHEKDVGAFDGATWVVRSPRKDGSTQTVCRGVCPRPALEGWLDQQLR